MSKTFATNSMVPERRKYQVLKTVQDNGVIGIKAGGKDFKFNKNSNDFYTDDTVLAKEICDTQGQNGTNDCIVIPIEKWDHNEASRRTQGGGSAYAAAWEAFEARRKDKDEK